MFESDALHILNESLVLAAGSTNEFKVKLQQT